MATDALVGSNARALARSLELVSLLLDGPHARQHLGAELTNALDARGWPSAQRTEADGLRNLARDLATLRELGLLTWTRSSTYRAEPGPQLPLWTTPAEAQALQAAVDALTQMGLPEVDILQRLLARIPLAVREAGKQSMVQLAPSAGVPQASSWAALQRGVVEGRVIQLTYQKPHIEHAETFTVDRAKVIWLTGAYYLVAYRPHYAIVQPGLEAWRYVREYRLDRILAATCLDAPVSLQSLPILRCRVILDAELRERVVTLRAADRHVVQYPEPLPDGTVRVTFEEVSLLRARQRVMAWGEHLLAVEEPAALREDVERAAKTLGRRFGT